MAQKLHINWTSTYHFWRENDEKPLKTVACAVSFSVLGFSTHTVAAAESDVAELEDFVISEVTDDLTILPSEPSDGAFGLDLTLLETPRSVTEVSSDLIKSYGLRSVDDLVRLTPGLSPAPFSAYAAQWIYGAPLQITTSGDFGE